MARVRNRQAGFTLIEIMFVCAIIAVLAALAIPAFLTESRKTKASSEVVAFFAELATRQEQYRVENGGYLSTALCPATTSQTGQAVTCANAGQPWAPLNVKLPTANAYCRYQTVAGSGTGTTGPGSFVFASPAGPWFYLRAQCDMDGDATMTEFFTSSLDSTIQRSSNEDD